MIGLAVFDHRLRRGLSRRRRHQRGCSARSASASRRPRRSWRCARVVLALVVGVGVTARGVARARAPRDEDPADRRAPRGRRAAARPLRPLLVVFAVLIPRRRAADRAGFSGSRQTSAAATRDGHRCAPRLRRSSRCSPATSCAPVARVLGWPLERIAGTTGRLARENAMRNPARTARHAAALMIGLGARRVRQRRSPTASRTSFRAPSSARFAGTSSCRARRSCPCRRRPRSFRPCSTSTWRSSRHRLRATEARDGQRGHPLDLVESSRRRSARSGSSLDARIGAGTYATFGRSGVIGRRDDAQTAKDHGWKLGERRQTRTGRRAVP